MIVSHVNGKRSIALGVAALVVVAAGVAIWQSPTFFNSGAGQGTPAKPVESGPPSRPSAGAPVVSSAVPAAPPGQRVSSQVVSHVVTPGGDPPTESKDAFVRWMAANRGEDTTYLGERWDRYLEMLGNGDLQNKQTARAFLMTPREAFVKRVTLAHAYDSNFLDIGYGVTISGPHAVGRMTSVLDVQPTDKVLEIGTGSGYQSAILSEITDTVWSIEIIKPLAARTRGVYDDLIARGYSEYEHIQTKQADGYYGWEEAAPFDKIIVTCGIDHIPPSLLQQLKVGGVMVIPVGPPGAQHVLKVTKQADADGSVTISRSDIYNGRIVPFVAFTKLVGDAIVGSHNK